MLKTITMLAILAVAIVQSIAPAEARHHRNHRVHVSHAHHGHHFAHHRGSHSSHHYAHGGGNSTGGLVPELAAKAEQIVGSCGAKIISAVRHTLVAGTNKISLHSYGRAVDVSGNYSCIYSHLAGWPGGYSVDPGVVHHVHVSYEPRGREWGARFVHGGHSHRYAHNRHHHSRYAQG